MDVNFRWQNFGENGYILKPGMWALASNITQGNSNFFSLGSSSREYNAVERSYQLANPFQWNIFILFATESGCDGSVLSPAIFLKACSRSHECVFVTGGGGGSPTHSRAGPFIEGRNVNTTKNVIWVWATLSSNTGQTNSSNKRYSAVPKAISTIHKQ